LIVCRTLVASSSLFLIATILEGGAMRKDVMIALTIGMRVASSRRLRRGEVKRSARDDGCGVAEMIETWKDEGRGRSRRMAEGVIMIF
jgi:hypothetical protein